MVPKHINVPLLTTVQDTHCIAEISGCRWENVLMKRGLQNVFCTATYGESPQIVSVSLCIRRQIEKGSSHLCVVTLDSVSFQHFSFCFLGSHEKGQIWLRQTGLPRSQIRSEIQNRNEQHAKPLSNQQLETSYRMHMNRSRT